MITKDTRDSCDRTIKNGEIITMIARGVEATLSELPDKMSLQMNEEFLGTKSLRAYCRDLLDTKEYSNA
jgi:hypothetical protein